MKTIQQIQEQYDIITLKEGKERGQLVALSDMGLLEEGKIDLVQTALKLEGGALSEAEKKSLVDLIQSLSAHVLSEAQSERFAYSDKSIPAIILLKRKSIRMFPGDTKIGLYYSQTLDRYISIPFSSKGSVDQPIIAEEKLSKKSKIRKASGKSPKYSDDVIKRLPADLQALHKSNSDDEEVNNAAREIVHRTPDNQLHKIKGFDAIRASNQRIDDRVGSSSASFKNGAKIGAAARILAQKAYSAYKARGEKKQAAEVDRKSELQKHINNYERFIKYGSDADKDKTYMPSDRSKNPVKVRAFYAGNANHAKNRIKQLGGTVPKVKPTKRIVGPIASPRKGVVKPPALAEGWWNVAGAVAKSPVGRAVIGGATKGAKYLARGAAAGGSKLLRSARRWMRRKRPDMNNNNNNSQNTQKPENGKSPRIQDKTQINRTPSENSFNQRVSVDQHDVRRNKAAFGSDPYRRQQQNESNLEVIRKIAESNAQKAEIEFTDKCIPLNYGIAKKFMAVYESLNTKNKEKVETMLNESSITCSKAINFAIRQ